MAKQSEQEFNPVKKEKGRKRITGEEFLKSFVEYFAHDERQPHECISSFLNHYEDAEVETEPQPEQPKIKTTAAYDNSRLEFLRIQIGPVQNFYQTLGNILHSLSLRVDQLQEQVIRHKVKQGLYEDYLKHTVEQNRIVTLDEFFDYWRIREEKVRKERDEAKTDKV